LLDPVELNVRFTTASGADRTLRIPGVERADNLTVRFKDKDFIEAFRAFYTMADLVDLVPYF
jgi:D-aminopeptidase